MLVVFRTARDGVRSCDDDGASDDGDQFVRGRIASVALLSALQTLP